MKRLLATCVLCSVLTPSVLADIYVIVNPDNPVEALDKKQTIDIFMGRTKAFQNGQLINAIDQPKASPLREDFYTTLTGKSLAYVNTYWARLFYTGRNQPPEDHYKNDEEIVDAVAKDRNAIAYVSMDSLTPDVKVAFTIELNNEKKISRFELPPISTPHH